jgi:hypothetical protein
MSPPLDSDSYDATFGGENRSPAQIDYVAYTTDVDLHLRWPFLAEDGAFIAPAKLDIIASGVGLKIFMPDASIASVGQDCLVRNIGVNAFTVCDFDGNVIVNITSGLQWLVWIVNDDTPAGQWASVQFGASVSNANAASLAGAGLRADITRLDQHLITTPLLSAHALTASDRARVLQNNGGTVTWTIADANVLGNGWFCYIINSGSGSLTIDPVVAGQTVDGSGTKVFAPGENAILFCDGSNFITVGYGRSLVSTVSGTSISLAPGGLFVLTPTQIAAQVQNWTGTLTSNAILEYGGGVGYWFVWNNTTGAFTVTARTGALDPGAVIPQGAFSIIRSDGANMHVAFTATTGTVSLINTQAGELVGGPITSTGTIGLADTLAGAGSIGSPGTSPADPALVPGVDFDIKGRITAAGQYPLNISRSVPVTSELFAAVLTDETGFVPAVAVPPTPARGVAVFSAGPTIDDAVLAGAPTAPTAPATPNSIPNKAYVDAAIAAAVGALFTFKTGDIKYTLNGTLDAGFLFLDGSTLGDATSGATHVGVTFQPLYEFLWNNFNNTLCPVSGGRTGSATADFNAHKTLQMIDARGRVLAGADNMGGVAAGRLGPPSDAGGIMTAATPGVSGGQQSHVLTAAEIPPGINSPASVLSLEPSGPSLGNCVFSGGGAFQYNWTNQTGAYGDPAAAPPRSVAKSHNVVQPTVVCNVLVKI